MTAFRFSAVRPDGGTVRGRIEASHGAEAVAVLSRRGLLPVAVAAIPESSPWPWQRPAAGDLALAFRGLASLMHAGIPLTAALDSLHRLLGGRLADGLARVRARVAEGAALGAALEAERSLFPPVTVGLIRAGESGVGLAAGVEAAARELERDAETRSSVAAALAYPVVLLAIGTVSLAAILVVVVPRFAEVLGDMGDTLPAATQLLLVASSVLRRYMAGLVVIVAVAIAVTVVVVRRGRQSVPLVHGRYRQRQPGGPNQLLRRRWPAPRVRVAYCTILSLQHLARRDGGVPLRCAGAAGIGAHTAPLPERAVVPVVPAFDDAPDRMGREPRAVGDPGAGS